MTVSLTMECETGTSVQRRITRSMLKKETPSTIVQQKTKLVKSTKTQLRQSKSVALSSRVPPPLSSHRFGLIQETTATELYALLVAAVFWNRTRGVQARPVFLEFLSRYPSPNKLAQARESDLAELIRPLGLYQTRARRFLAFAKAWIEAPPSKSRRYRKLHYPDRGCGLDIGKDEVLDEEDEREAWEIAHLPSIGPYALDSFRIFHRDMMRDLATDWNGGGAAPDFEPEWKRVVPLDKELRAYLKWMWLKEGWKWDPMTGRRVKAKK